MQVCPLPPKGLLYHKCISFLLLRNQTQLFKIPAIYYCSWVYRSSEQFCCAGQDWASRPCVCLQSNGHAGCRLAAPGWPLSHGPRLVTNEVSTGQQRQLVTSRQARQAWACAQERSMKDLLIPGLKIISNILYCPKRGTGTTHNQEAGKQESRPAKTMRTGKGSERGRLRSVHHIPRQEHLPCWFIWD